MQASVQRAVRVWSGGVRVFGGCRSLSRDIGQPTHYTHPELLQEGEVMPGVHKTEFAQRRTSLMQLIASSHTGITHDKHVVIIPGACIRYMSADVPYRFHQNTDFLYLCGFKEPDAVLVLEAGKSSTLPDHRAVLYVRPRDPYRELWDGPRAGTEDTVEFTGVDESYTIEELGEHLEKKYSSEGYCVWYASENSTHPDHTQLITDALTRSPHSKIKDVHDPTLNISQLRLVKSPSEQALMRQAGRLAGQAFREAMKATHPGVREAVLESVFEHSVKTSGAQWLSFPPVVAGGNRACCLHYITNDKTVKAGDLVLMDAGCEYHGYVSDVTRTWPVSGQFSAAQRDLYEVVRTAKEELIQICRPGVTLNYLHSEANEILISQLKAAGLAYDKWSSSYQLAQVCTDVIIGKSLIKDFLKSSQVMGKLFPHHVGHYLGMDTHDTMAIERNTLLAPGMVVTIEPGLYMAEEMAALTPTARELLGTGIRLEDNVLVTEDGAEILNKDCPGTLQELSQLIPIT